MPVFVRADALYQAAFLEFFHVRNDVFSCDSDDSDKFVLRDKRICLDCVNDFLLICSHLWSYPYCNAFFRPYNIFTIAV